MATERSAAAEMRIKWAWMPGYFARLPFALLCYWLSFGMKLHRRWPRVGWALLPSAGDWIYRREMWAFITTGDSRPAHHREARHG